MDHGVLVYKVDNPVQSSLLSSLMLTLNIRFPSLINSKVIEL